MAHFRTYFLLSWMISLKILVGKWASSAYVQIILYNNKWFCSLYFNKSTCSTVFPIFLLKSDWSIKGDGHRSFYSRAINKSSMITHAPVRFFWLEKVVAIQAWIKFKFKESYHWSAQNEILESFLQQKTAKSSL